MTPRALIVSLSVGGGHGRAGEVVAAALAERAPAWETRCVDLRDHMAPWLRLAYVSGYLFAIRHVPWLYGFFYRHPPRRSGVLPGWALRHGLRSFERLVRDLEPAVILATQITASEAVNALRARGVHRGAAATVVTDFDAHPSWRAEHIDAFFVPDEIVGQGLARRGIPAERIEATGVPIDPAFEQRLDVAALQGRHGVRPGVPVVLLMGGSLGLGSLEATVRALLALGQPLDLLVVAGRNARLRRRLGRIEPPGQSRLRVFGFVAFVPELMAVADLFVSKPGGLSMTEAMTAGVPTLVVAPLAGHEQANAAHLEAIGAVRRPMPGESVADAVAALLDDPDARRALGARARACAQPHTARRIAGRLVELAAQRVGQGARP